MFVEILFAIILMFAGPRGASPDDQIRLHSVAQETWDVASSASVLPIQGEAGAEATAVVLASVAAHESGFWSKVQDCTACKPGSLFCDQGRSVSLFQLHVAGLIETLGKRIAKEGRRPKNPTLFDCLS